MRIEQSLEKIFGSIGDLPWDHQLYVGDANLADLQASALVLDDDSEDERDDEDEPAFATSRGYQYFLGIADLQSIERNLSYRVPRFTLQQFVEAVLHYHNHDEYLG